MPLEAIAPRERLAAVSSRSPARADFDEAVEMLVGGGAGAERTEEGYRALLQSAGFEVKRIVALASGASAVEAVPAGG